MATGDPMDDIEFYKMSGSGNDFILIDGRQGQMPAAGRPEFARRVCRRRLSVGADGLIIIEPSNVADFKWHFLNADGSEAGMCGNGARCAARFACLIGAAGSRMRFETLAGLIRADVDSETVKIQMTDPNSNCMVEDLQVDDRTVSVHCIDTGVPHAVIAVEDLEDIDVDAIGRRIRYHRHFEPEGTNVNFIKTHTNGTVGIRTYERGVEAETLACGTGSVAGAIIASRLFDLEPPIRMIVRSGLPLDIDFTRTNEGYREVYLKGEARVVYRGTMAKETFG